jgi:uncharacterized membrane-anchored protein
VLFCAGKINPFNMQKALFVILTLLLNITIYANEDSTVAQLIQQVKFMDSVNKAMKYQTGVVKTTNGVAQLNVPAGFKYLNAQQSNYVITELWGNPPRTDVMGMLFPESGGPFADTSYAFIISYKAIGYVKDEDADKIDYDDMLKNMQKEEVEVNVERKKNGYPSIHIVGWAQKPFYDKTNKVLHWAKELKFGDSEDRTLNYDIRILGRKGILSMNAVATMNELDMVKKDINKVLHIAEFTEGNKYSDFDSNIDEVAAWTIGGLVAGKVLAKVGILAFLGKFLKVILIGLVAIGGAIVKFFKRKKSDEQVAYEQPNNEVNS